VGFLDIAQCKYFLRYLHLVQRDNSKKGCTDVSKISTTVATTIEESSNAKARCGFNVFESIADAKSNKIIPSSVASSEYRLNPAQFSDVNVSLLAKPTTSSEVIEVLEIADDEKVYVMEQEGDWVRVSLPGRAQSLGGWMRRRHDDQEYLVPYSNDVVETSEVLVDFSGSLYVDELPRVKVAKERKGPSEEKNPMFQINETCGNDNELLPETVQSPMEVVLHNMDTLNESIISISMMGILSLAQDCISTIFSSLQEGEQLFMECFDCPERLLAYIKTLYLRSSTNNLSSESNSEKGSRFDSVVNILKQFERHNENERETWQSLMNFSLNQLSFFIMREGETLLPPSQGVVKTLVLCADGSGNMVCSFESDNSEGSDNILTSDKDSTYSGKVTLPAAQFITCILESEDDVPIDQGSLEIGMDITSTEALTVKKHIVVPGDSCVITWKPTDEKDIPRREWTVKVVCYGQVMGPSQQLREICLDSISSSEKPSIELACWLLKFLVRSGDISVESCLYSSVIIAGLRKFLESVKSIGAQREVVQVVLTMFNKRIPNLSSETITEVSKLAEAITTLCNKQKKIEGTGATSQYLQSLIESSLVLNDRQVELDMSSRVACWEDKSRILSYHDTNVQLKLYSTSTLSDQEYVRNGSRTFHTRISSTSTSPCEVYTGVMSSTGSRLNFNDIALSDDLAFTVAWAKQTLTVCYRSGDTESAMRNVTVPFGPEIYSGDIVSVEVDMLHGLIIFFRNSVVVGVAVGPIGSGAYVELDLLKVCGSLHFFGSLNSIGESLLLLQTLSSSVVCDALSLTVQDDDLPSWLKCMQDSVQILQSCKHSSIPKSVLLDEFLPRCEKNAQVSIFCESFISDLKKDVMIPHANTLSISLQSSQIGDSSAGIMIKSPLCSCVDPDTKEIVYLQEGDLMKQDITLPPFLPQTSSAAVKRFRHAGCAALKTRNPETDNVKCSACHGFFKGSAELKKTLKNRGNKDEALPLPSLIVCTDHSCVLQPSDAGRISNATCDVCEEEDAESKYFCSDCDFDICESCFEPDESAESSRSTHTDSISDPPEEGVVVSFPPSCLTSQSTAGGKLLNVFDYSETNYWEESNSSDRGCVTITLTQSEFGELGEEFCLEFFNANIGGAYDPTKITVRVNDDTSNQTVQPILDSGKKRWMRILTSDQIDSSSSDEGLKIRLHFYSEGCNFKVTGLRFVCTREHTKYQFCSAPCEQHGPDTTALNTTANVDELCVGDFVVRARDWKWGDEDGGAGSIGTVVEVTSWRDESDAGVRVKWQRSNFEGLYRWNVEDGYCDVALVRRGRESNRKLTIPGDSLTFQLMSSSFDNATDEAKKATSNWQGSPSFNGSSTVMQLPYSSDMDFIEDFTVETWVRISPDVGEQSTKMPILSRRIETDPDVYSDQFSLSLNIEAGSIGKNNKVLCSQGHEMDEIAVGQRHPKYECGYAECNICDVPTCTTSSELSYFCSKCDYDMCHACGIRNATEERPRCPAGHFSEALAVGVNPVAYKEFGTGQAECDSCGYARLSKNGLINYHCPHCQHDMCHSCGIKAAKKVDSAPRAGSKEGRGDVGALELIRPRCEHGHKMDTIDAGCRVKSYEGSQYCDYCRQVALHKTNKTNYHCEECKYDLCHDCGEMSIFQDKYPHYRLTCEQGHSIELLPKGDATHTCSKCSKAKKKMLYLYCETCSEAICASCAKSSFMKKMPRMNRDGAFAALGSNKKYYCGRQEGCCSCGGCDGRCGPTNGCACPACEELSQQHVLMAPHYYHARVRRGESFDTDQVGLINCDTTCRYTQISDNWAKVDPSEYSRLEKGENFESHEPETEGYCAMVAKDGDQILYKEGYYFPPLYKTAKVTANSRCASISFTAMNIEMKTAIDVTGGSICVGKWAHVGVVVSGNKTSIYVNGVRAETSSVVTGQRMGGLGAPMLVGCTADWSSMFKGHMHDLRLWNIPRSENDILKFKDEPVRDPKLFASMLLGPQSLVVGATTEVVDRKEGAPDPVITTPEVLMDVVWDDEVEEAKEYPLTDSVLQCIVTPKFSLDTILQEDLFQEELAKFKAQYASSKLKADKAMVRFINSVSIDRELSIDYLLKCSWKDLAPSGSHKRSRQLLNEYLKMNNSSDESVIEARFTVIQRLNKSLLVAIPYFDLCTMDKPGTLSNLLCSMRGLVFNLTKLKFWSEALSKTEVSSDKFKVKLSRSRATKHALTGVPDHDGKMMVFSQAFRQIHPLPPRRLRRKGQLYNTIFMGEHSNDAGGPYSESFAMMCLELQSSSLPLFIRTRNGVGNIGQNKEKWVFNPAAKSSLHMEMFSFLGKLMGTAIRSKEYLGLNIPSIIWKLLVKDVPTRSDLDGINISYVQSLDRIRQYNEETMAYMEQTFTLTTWDKKEVELIPGGSQELVTFETRDRYCDLCEQYCLHEYDAQAAAVRQGMGTVVPPHLLSLYSWQELDHMVCGNPVIDVALLESMTSYQSCSSSDEHIRNFWKVMEDYSEDEKSAFLRFTWGRSRLPLTKEGFSRKLKIESFTPRGRSTATQDESLPVSHTCFFSLELPRYSTIEILREKLTYAIMNCVAIDVDNDSTGQSAAEMGWEEF